MSASPPPQTPSLRHHKTGNRAFVEINKQRIYLGRWGSKEATTAYHRTIAEWAANGYRLPVAPEVITVAEVCARYMQHCDEYYVDRHGNRTTTHGEAWLAVQAVDDLYGDVPAVEFKAAALRAVRQQWIDRNLAISTINSYTNSVRAIFRWATSHDLIPPETLTALQSVPGLRRGRGVGRDTKVRQTIPLEHIDAVCDHLPSPLRAVVKLLLFTGARPSEILNLKRGDIDCNGDVWAAVIRDHKLAYKGITRTVYFGPRAQNILRPFLLRGDNEYLFNPREAVKERRRDERKDKEKGGRQRWQKDDPRATDRVIGECYDHRAFSRAIRRVCKQHDIPAWSPYQLRHTAATMAEASADADTARALLGHADLDTTAIYVHRDNKTAATYAALHG